MYACAIPLVDIFSAQIKYRTTSGWVGKRNEIPVTRIRIKKATKHKNRKEEDVFLIGY